MLKIKDNVDLKELEKFGFKKHNVSNGVFYKKEFKDIEGFKNIIININREIKLNINCVDNSVPSEIFDLIKADLVEKVSDGNE